MINFVDRDSKLANIFTKPLPRYSFYHLHNELAILSESNLIGANMGTYIHSHVHISLHLYVFIVHNCLIVCFCVHLESIKFCFSIFFVNFFHWHAL